jgi:hypothetical protein
MLHRLDHYLQGQQSSKAKGNISELCAYLICEGVSKWFRRKGKRYNIRSIFRTRHALRGPLMSTRSERDMLLWGQRDCGIGKTGASLVERLRGHEINFKEGLSR